MTYIINPIWFYLIGLAGGLQIFCLIVGIGICMVTGIIALVSALEHFGWKKEWTKPVAKFLIIGSIFTFIGLTIPSEKTCYQMLVASAFTYENVDYAIETGKDIVDYILETTEEVMDLTEEGEE